MADAVMRPMVITEIDDYRRLRLSARGTDLRRRPHCVVVSADDPAILDAAVAAARAGLATRNQAYPERIGTLASITVSALSDADRTYVGKAHPRVLSRTTSIVVAGRTRADMNTVLHMLRSGRQLVAEVVEPRSFPSPATVVLTEAQRRRLAVAHPELRRMRAAVVVTHPSADMLLTHLHSPASRLLETGDGSVVSIVPTPAEKQQLRSRHRELAVHGEMHVFAGADVAAPLASARLLQALVRYRNSISGISWAQMPPHQTPKVVLQVVANRQLMARSCQLLTAAQVGQRAHSRQARPAHLAQTWKSQGRVFAYRDNGQMLYPAFQFGTDGRPLPEVARILAATDPFLRGGLSTGVWFVKPNRHLGGATPAAAMANDVAGVEKAAADRMVEHVRQIKRRSTIRQKRYALERGIA